MRDIVVGVDTSATAGRAAIKAAELAAAFGARLHLVMTVDKSNAAAVKVGADSFQTDWLTEADQTLKDMARGLPHDSIVTAVKSGSPAEAICAEAERVGADLIVVGNRRVQGVSRVLGSVASEITKRAHCDVYIAHTREGLTS